MSGFGKRKQGTKSSAAGTSARFFAIGREICSSIAEAVQVSSNVLERKEETDQENPLRNAW